MSTELERQLHSTLVRYHEAELPDAPDAWTRFVARERRHRTQRVARRLSSTVVGLGLTVAITLGAVPLPGFVPGLELSAALAQPLLGDEATRGTLAGDRAWLTGLRRHLQSDEDEGWRIVDRDRAQVHFAGDVPGARLALVTYVVQKGLLRDRMTSWYMGADGATPQAMDVMSQQDPEKVSSLMSGSDEGTGFLVVVAPPGAQVRVGLGITYGADGRVRPTTWIPGTANGLAVVAVPASSRAPRTTLEVTRNGSALPASTQIDWSASGAAPGLSGRAVSRALAQSPAAPTIDLATAKVWAQDAMNEAGLDPASTTVAIPWTGLLRGRRAALIALTPAGGGRLVLGYSGTLVTSKPGTSYEWQRELDLLVPAEGADTRPLLWREWAEIGITPSSEVNVVLAAGTARAELVRGDRPGATAITPDAKGYAKVQVPVGKTASVRAYDRQGRLIGETALPDLSAKMGEIVGSTRETRLVD